jgi:hypothetical protein
MQNPWLARNRTKLALVALLIAGLVASAGSGSGAAASPGNVSLVRPATCVSSSTLFCFEKVDYKSGKCNQLTGINDFQAIVGAYNNCSGGDYSSFAATSPQATGMPSGLPSYPPGDFVTEMPPGSSGGDYNVFLQGMDNGQKNLTNTIMVGSYQPPSSKCSGSICGAWDKNPSWTPIVDPNQGFAPCNVTEVLAVNDSHLAVGYYEKNIAQTDICSQQAFEYYPIGKDSSDSNDGPVFQDLTPTPPSTSAILVSSEAIGINQLGDIVGTLTWHSGAQTYTSGWLYADRAYYNNALCHPSCPPTDNTYALGVNYNDDVVGYYVSGTAYVGYIMDNPKDANPKFQTIDYNPGGKNYTVVHGINSNCLIAGTTEGSDGTLHGFVGFPQSNCPGAPDQRQARAKTSRKSHKS